MSQLTDFAENALIDFMRGQGLTLPTNWHMAYLSAASDSSVTESGGGLTRSAVPRSLTYWAGTQSSGSTSASIGTSHTTSNNTEIPMGTASSEVEAVAIGMFDASTDGNCWMVFPLTEPLEISIGAAPSITAGLVSFSLGLSGGMTDYLANKLIDLIFRGQSFSWPATMYLAGFTAAPTNAGGGTEIGGGVGYARASIASSLEAWAGTQAAGSVVASSGTGGRTSNNAPVIHPQPTGTQGTWVAGGIYDASSAGNLFWWHALTASRSVNAASAPPNWAAGAIDLGFA